MSNTHALPLTSIGIADIALQHRAFQALTACPSNKIRQLLNTLPVSLFVIVNNTFLSSTAFEGVSLRLA